MNGTATLPRAVARFLRATYPGCRRPPNESALCDYARAVKAKAFPQFETDLEFIFLNSRRRSCRQVINGGKGFIFIDQGEAALLTIEDFILRRNDFEPEDGLVLLQLPFAEAFLHGGELERALICTLRCLAQAPRLANLLRGAFREPGHSTLGLFLLLHELAHFAVDTGQPFAMPVREMVSGSLDAHCDANMRYSGLIERGEALPPDVSTSVQDQSREARTLMARQMLDHVGFVRNNPEVIREASCDFLATAGMMTCLLNWQPGIDTSDARPQATNALTRRNAGDILMLGLRVSRLLMLHHFLDLTAENIARQQDPSRLSKAFAEMTARHNVSVNLALERFEEINETWRFVEPQESTNNMPPDYVTAFRRDVEILNTRSAERLLTCVETIGLAHRDSGGHEQDLAQLRQEFFGGKAPGQSELDEALHDLIMKLPL